MSVQLLPLAAPVLAFTLCAAVASYAQNLTGFAFSLILLGLSSLLEIASISDAANAAMVLSLVNAWAYLRAHPAPIPWRLLRPILTGSVFGVVAGLALLAWLSAGAIDWLRGLLGLSIVVCAVLFMLQSRTRATLSPPQGFTFAGVLSGVLAGLFSSGGPPLVFHLYRQPVPADQIRRVLLLSFAFASAVRLVIVVPTGQFTMQAGVLTLAALPAVYGVTKLHRRLPHRLSPHVRKWLVGGLLCVAGASLLISAWSAIQAG